jgi:hypothetical protein
MDAVPIASLLIFALASTACSSSSADDPTPGATTSSLGATSAHPFHPAKPIGNPRSADAARIDPSSLPVPEDFEQEFRKQITSSNYLDALNSAAAEASAAAHTH